MLTTLLGAIADGRVDGMTLAVVCILPVVELVVGATMIVDGSHGSEVVYVPVAEMLVTPTSDEELVLVLVLVMEGVMVDGGRRVVSGG